MNDIKVFALLFWALVIHPFQWVYFAIQKAIQNRIEIKKFKRAKKEADHLHQTTGKRFHVLPKSGDKLAVVNNSYIKYYNKQKGVKKINIHDLLKMSYYSTN